MLPSKKKRKKIINSEGQKYQPRLKVQLSHFHFSRCYVMRSFLMHWVLQSIQNHLLYIIDLRFQLVRTIHMPICMLRRLYIYYSYRSEIKTRRNTKTTKKNQQIRKRIRRTGRKRCVQNKCNSNDPYYRSSWSLNWLSSLFGT